MKRKHGHLYINTPQRKNTFDVTGDYLFKLDPETKALVLTSLIGYLAGRYEEKGSVSFEELDKKITELINRHR